MATACKVPRGEPPVSTGSGTSLGNLPASMYASGIEIGYWRRRGEIASELWHAYNRRAPGLNSPPNNRLWAWRTLWLSYIEHQSYLCRQKIDEINKRSVHDESSRSTTG